MTCHTLCRYEVTCQTFACCSYLQIRLEGLQALKPRMLAVSDSACCSFSGSGGASGVKSGTLTVAREQAGLHGEKLSTVAHVDLHAGTQGSYICSGATPASAVGVAAELMGTQGVQCVGTTGMREGVGASASFRSRSPSCDQDTKPSSTGLDVQLQLAAVPSHASASAGSYGPPAHGPPSIAPLACSVDENSNASSATATASRAEDTWIVESIQAGVQEAVSVIVLLLSVDRACLLLVLAQ